jgi:hypothetical protein
VGRSAAGAVGVAEAVGISADLDDRPTRSMLGHLEHRDGVPHGFAPAGRAEKFPEATFFKMDRSSTWSATIRLRRKFSCSRPFSRLA